LGNYAAVTKFLLKYEDKQMGLGGVSIWQLLVVLVIVVLLFGTKRLKSFGGDLGESIKGFRGAMQGVGGKGEVGKITEQDDDLIDGKVEVVSEATPKNQ